MEKQRDKAALKVQRRLQRQAGTPMDDGLSDGDELNQPTDETTADEATTDETPGIAE